MKITILLMATMVSLTACQTETSKNNSGTTETSEQQAIETLLFAYRDALNASDVSAVLSLYTENGIFMPSGAPTSVGTEQIKGAYEFVFSNIKLSIEFFIDEIVIDGEFAFARTTSKVYVF